MRLTGAARIVGVLGLVAGTGDVLVLLGVVMTTLASRVVLRRRGPLLDGAGGGVVVGRIVRTLGRHDDRREDPKERDNQE